MSQLHLAFYLPQFHPIPENDQWWGSGFTEWSNVSRSRPRFAGHYQPHIPAELGYYDLRQPDVREAQAGLATSHGIDAFCYYHYWFGGKRLLERPFDEVLESGKPSMPFALCWANENWTRSWDGMANEVLIPQRYDREVEHARWLTHAFADERYVRVDGKPLFLVYRASDLPDPVATTRLWRDVARSSGVGELFLCRVESFPSERTQPERLGFDASVQFAPDWLLLQQRWRRFLVLAGGWAGDTAPRVHDYAKLARRMMAKPDPGYVRFPCVTPGWDNSPRRQDAPLVLRDATPEVYEGWVRAAATSAPRTPDGDSMVFVNAWNEWGEGAHLEPDQKWGRAFLEAHRRARASVAAAAADR
jgi:lipopolysaccharide biosynthesis protein